jgi:tellurite resistance protein TerC
LPGIGSASARWLPFARPQRRPRSRSSLSRQWIGGVVVPESIGNPWMWGTFFGIVVGLLAVDLFALGGNRAHRVSIREAAGWSLAWLVVALAFGAGLWWWLGRTAGPEVADAQAVAFLAGYLIEKSLAVDNVFVWLMLFGYFAIPADLQRRVLLYGVLGAIAMRTAMILGGAWLIARFDWILYVFGAFLLATGVKMWVFAGKEPDLARNPVLRWMRGHLRITEGLRGERFVVRENGLLFATPLLLVLVLVEITDVIFAVDSVPAIFAVTTDPFIVLTSNVFAILGLRAMYFLLAGVAERFALLKYGLALVLAFVGAKMLLLDVWKIPVALSLGVVATIIAGSVALSLWRTRKASGEPPMLE